MRKNSIWLSRFTCLVICIVTLGCSGRTTTPPPDVEPPDVEDTKDVPIDVDDDGADMTIPDADDPDTADTTLPDGIDVPPTPQPCDPPLSVIPSETAVLPLDLLTIAASGGTGTYRFALGVDPAPSGGLVNALTGAYLSGDVTGVTDTVEVTDLGCIGSATAALAVVPKMVVSPLWVEVLPQTSFTFSIFDGSSVVAFDLTNNGSGGSVSPAGVYTAGPVDGLDVVEIVDVETGQVETAAITVRQDATLGAVPSQIFIPLGAKMQLTTEGGSGTVSTIITDDVVSYDDGWFHGDNTGTTTVLITDDFTDMTTSIAITVVESQQAPMMRHGDTLNAGTVIAPGDVDGDGYADAILGMAESDIGAFNGGAVYIYRGNGSGLDATPARILSVNERAAEFGRSIAAGDILNNDKLVDLVVGAPRLNHGGTDNGAIHIYEGIPNGLFSENPTVIRAGEYSYHLMGYSVAICDFNDDGRMDLAVGSLHGEDRDASTIVSDTGAVHIFLGYTDGILAEPDMTVYGELPNTETGILEPKKSLLLARQLAAGDMDGDGKCDLAVAGYTYSSGPGRGYDGLVAIYRGIGSSNEGPGGIEAHPVRFYGGLAAGDAGSNLGRRIAVGDLNGDDKAELVMGQWGHDGAKGNIGAVRVVYGGDLNAGPATTILSAEEADWTLEGVSTNDYFGWNVLVDDVNNDDIGDLLAGNWNGEVAGGQGDSGTVNVHYGLEDSPLEQNPDIIFGSLPGGGLVSGDRYGQAMAVLHNPADGSAEHLLSMTNLADTIGNYVGQPFLSPIDEPTNLTGLDMPGNPAGSRFGFSSAVVGDVNGDGWNDLVIGSPHLETPEKAYPNTGAAFLYLGTAEGFESSPSVQFAGYAGHSWGDELGWDVSNAGDFNGDDIPDIAVIARADDRPLSFGSGYAGPTTCGAKTDNVGAVFVFLGSSSGLPDATPAFVYFGSQKSIYTDRLDGGFNINGDDKDDLILGAFRWDLNSTLTDVGQMSIVHGRAATPGKITVICEADFTVHGLVKSDYLGRSVAALGDINGDGCDEVAVGADAEDLSGSAAGSVRIVYGWGNGCLYGSAHVSVFTSGSANARAGWSMDGGESVDDDALPDLAVGGYNYVSVGNAVGAAWVIPGSYIKSKTPIELVNNTLSAGDPTHLFLDASVAGNHQVKGATAGGKFGQSVALVPNISGNGRAGLAVGAPLANVYGSEQAGGAYLFRFDLATGLEATPMAAVGGETYRLSGFVGDWVAAGRLGNKNILTVGGYYGNAAGLEGVDQGGLYVIELPDSPQ